MTEQQLAAMRQALDNAVNSVLSPGWVMMKNEDFTALRTALEQAETAPVQEQPVLIPASLADKQFERYYRQGYDAGFAAQRQWVGLTEEEILECRSVNHLYFYKAIEAKLREKNTGESND